MSTVHEDMQSVFRHVFGEDDLVLRDEMTAADIDGWDSLAHINLIVAIEKRFGIKFATAEISGLKEEGQNIGTFRRLLESKLSNKK